jgi:hypothetical protein
MTYDSRRSSCKIELEEISLGFRGTREVCSIAKIEFTERKTGMLKTFIMAGTESQVQELSDQE